MYYTAESQREQKTISVMIQICCKQKEHRMNDGVLCTSCQALLDYAVLRIEKCPFQPNKGPCESCSVHCYNKEMRMAIKKVMVCAGPLMVMAHPLLALRHLLLKYFRVNKMACLPKRRKVNSY